VKVLLAVALVCALCAGEARGQSTLTFSGSSTIVPLVADLAYYYRRTLEQPPRFELHGGVSPTGLADAFRGISSAGMVARDREPGDPPSLVFHPIALSAVCIVTNTANPIPSISRADLQGLVAGRTTDWSQVPGATQTGPISTTAFAPGTAASTVFANTFVDPATPVALPTRSFTTARLVRASVTSTPNGWGYVDLAFTQGLHRVAYEGIPCDDATIASGAYPARRTLNLVTRGRPGRALARFLTWVRTDPIARRVVATRYVPVQRSAN
jgi:phosphate transport system substrate-binding protein